MDAATPISKIDHEHYLRTYTDYLKPIANEPFVLLEIGIADGDSLYYWRDHYPNAIIIGIDIRPIEINDTSGRVFAYQGKQQDLDLLDKIRATHAPDGFDAVVDDGSHIGHYTRQTFWHVMKNHLKVGGLYFVEDWGTSYWPLYNDGKLYQPRPVGPNWRETLFESFGALDFVKKNAFLSKVAAKLEFKSMQTRFPSHMNGMVGFVKELVDEAGMPDATDERYGNGPQRKSMFEWMRISVGHVVIKKADTTKRQ